MQGNVIATLWIKFKNILEYKPPSQAKQFVLTEGNNGKHVKDKLVKQKDELVSLIEYGKTLLAALEQTKGIANSSNTHEEMVRETTKLQDTIRTAQKIKRLLPKEEIYRINSREFVQLVKSTIIENEQIIKKVYQTKYNKDVIVRHFTITFGNKVSKKAMLVFIDNIVDEKVINLTIINPLMRPLKNILGDNQDVMTAILDRHLPNKRVVQASVFGDVTDYINRGYTALFLEGAAEAALLETTNIKSRGVEKADIERSVRGPQNAFTEQLSINVGLLRSIMPTSDLIAETLIVGLRVPNKCAVIYLKSLANPQLVKEVRRRINSIQTDYIGDTGVLEQFIEDNPNSPFPQALSTERPDRVASALTEGRVAILLANNPFAYVVPVSVFTFFQAAPDFGLKYPAGTIMRLIRYLGTAISLLLPGIYLAINYYHQEALPTELVIAISAAREKVPLPALVEILLLELSFELLREAGFRVPSALGPAISIVGAIILGQAAVMANIVSPIMVVIISISGLASFTIPNYQMLFSIRMLRFIFLLMAALMGLVGVAFGVLTMIAYFSNMKSFGVPYLAPMAPKTFSGVDVITRGAVYAQERRPDEIQPQDSIRQPNISRRWIKRNSVKGD